MLAGNVAAKHGEFPSSPRAAAVIPMTRKMSIPYRDRLVVVGDPVQKHYPFILETG